MKYTIFNETVSLNIPDEIVRKYEAHAAPLTNKRVEYLAVTGECDGSESISDIESAVVSAINDEIDAFDHLTEITARAIAEGIVK